MIRLRSRADWSRATVPETVALYTLPDSELRYVNLNGQYVFVEPQERKIVYIER